MGCPNDSLAIAASACGHSSPSSAPSGTANQLVADGLAAQQKGNVTQAFYDYLAAQREDPQNKYARYDLGYIYQVRHRTKEALSEYRSALAIDPNFPQALYNLAVLESPTDPLASITLYQRVITLQSNNASALFNLGVLLVRNGQTARGRADVRKAIRLNPALRSLVPAGIL